MLLRGKKGGDVAHSSFLVLLPPKARPEFRSSRLAKTLTCPPRAWEMRGRGWMGEGPKVSGSRGMLANGSGSSKSAISFVQAVGLFK